jgi:N-[(2S)-2-amino-2-carboxyethyl]-L-glutamate dehydrogenase
MYSSAKAPTLSVISGAQVHDVLDGRQRQVVEIIERTYRVHGEGAAVNPPSYFLSFPEKPEARIIALPASLGGEQGLHGLKWISSFPGNVASGLPRASAVLVLNDQQTGYPFACLESSIISAARTAASAALAADVLSRDRVRPTRIGFVGTGLIARYIHTYLAATGWSFDEIAVHDIRAEHAAGFAGYLERSGAPGPVVIHDHAEDLIRRCDLIVFATIAGTPYLHEPDWFSHNPLVLHVSLRDLSPDVILAAANVVDDVDHCLRANTSVHLTEQREGNRDFLNGTLYEVMTGKSLPPADRPLIFSPFGLGVLDLALGKFVYDEARRQGQDTVIDDFYFDLDRYGQASK